MTIALLFFGCSSKILVCCFAAQRRIARMRLKRRFRFLFAMEERESVEMKKTDDMPIWVYLAFSSIETRKVALWLIWSCILFSAYCIPWGLYFAGHAWVAKIFLIDNWSWFAMMVPMTLWYWVSLKWIDKHAGWADSQRGS